MELNSPTESGTNRDTSEENLLSASVHDLILLIFPKYHLLKTILGLNTVLNNHGYHQREDSSFSDEDKWLF